MPARTYTPLVTAAARRYGVELDSLAGTGPGGRVSIKDVKAAAAANAPHLRAVPPPDAAEPAPKGTAWGRNPLLDEARSKDPDKTMRAFRTAGPAPTLFPTGDLPPFTASGIDPKALLQVPWLARHPIAAEPSQAAAYRMVDFYASEDGEIASKVDFTGHPGNVDYRERMRAWVDAR